MMKWWLVSVVAVVAALALCAPAAEADDSVVFMIASIGSGVIYDPGSVNAWLEADGIGPNTRLWYGRSVDAGMGAYTFDYSYGWQSFLDIFEDEVGWYTLLHADRSEGAYNSILFKNCFGPCTYWNMGHISGDLSRIDQLAEFMEGHPEIQFIVWTCLPRCGLVYVAGSPHVPEATIAINDHLKQAVSGIGNVHVFDAWEVVADADPDSPTYGMLRDECLITPGDRGTDCDSHWSTECSLDADDILYDVIAGAFGGGDDDDDISDDDDDTSDDDDDTGPDPLCCKVEGDCYDEDTCVDFGSPCPAGWVPEDDPGMEVCEDDPFACSMTPSW